MYKEVLRSIDGIGVFPVISFVIFFAFFIGLFIYVYTMKQETVDHMSHKPLEEDPDFTNEQTQDYDKSIFR